MRLAFEELLKAWRAKHKILFHADGARNMGNGVASSFWRGYDGTQIGGGFIDRASRETLTYAYWKAGRAARAEADRIPAPQGEN